MPHIIIEHSHTSFRTADFNSLLSDVFNAVESTAFFNKENIKVRLQSIDYFKLDNQHKGFVHIQCRIHKGRESEQKKRLSSAILQTITRLVNPMVVTTIEIIDMDSESYAKSITP